MSHAALRFSVDIAIMTTFAQENQDFLWEHFSLTLVDIELLIKAIVVLKKEFAEIYRIDQ